MKPADDEALADSAAEQGVLSEAATAVEQPCVVAAPIADTKWQAFTRITAVQQALVLFVGSVAYDAGSVAYVGPVSGASRGTPQQRPLTRFASCLCFPSYLVDLLTASVFFLLASALFVIGLGLDLREMKQTRAQVCVFNGP
jgi:hypothetical protein